MKQVIWVAVVCSVVCSMVLSAVPGRAATDEEKCWGRRGIAGAKYERCVRNWLGRCYGRGDCEPLGSSLEKLSKCRIKYAQAWPKLQSLIGTECDAPRWVDNGDETVRDNLTGLTWEKKTDDSGVHDRDNLYTWTNGDADFTDEDGTVFTTFLSSLNSGGGFAGANGWRLPTFAELQTILLPEPYPCSSDPCIDPSFGLTASSFYWSSTTSAFSPEDAAWLVDFFDGGVDDDGKDASIIIFVRAVRGGL